MEKTITIRILPDEQNGNTSVSKRIAFTDGIIGGFHFKEGLANGEIRLTRSQAVMLKEALDQYFRCNKAVSAPKKATSRTLKKLISSRKSNDINTLLDSDRQKIEYR